MNAETAVSSKETAQESAKGSGGFKSSPGRQFGKLEQVFDDTNLFFPDSESDSGPALAVCAVCPVRAQCLDFALRTRQNDGVWGGHTETERKRIRRRMGRTAA